MFLFAFLLYNLKDYNNPSQEYYVYFVCPDLAPYRYFQYDGFSNFLVLFILAGFNLGLTILFYLITNYIHEEGIIMAINDFVNTSFLKSVLRLLFLAATGIPAGIPFLAVSSKADFWIVYVFKLSIPYFFLALTVASVGIFFAYKLKLTYSNEDNVRVSQIIEQKHEARVLSQTHDIDGITSRKIDITNIQKNDSIIK